MGDLRNLSTMLSELDDQLVGCMKCGMCQGVCPIFAQTRNEGDVARGKLYLIEGLAGRMIRDARGVKERLDRCLMCGTCAANCPSGVSAMEIFLRARAILTGYLKLSPLKKAIFQGLLSRPERFARLLDWAEKFQNLFTTPASESMGTRCSRIMSPLIGDRHFVPLAERAFHKIQSAMDTPRGRSGFKAAFYVGCVVDKIYPAVGEAAMKVFDHHGVGVFLPADQGCCGIPALASGDTDTFTRLLAHNMERFAGNDFDVLVTPCATCTSTIREIWPMMAEKLAPGRAMAVRELASKTMDVSEFIVDRIGVVASDRTGQGRRKVTYHDPCHLAKSLGVASQPRTLIRCNPDFDLVEMNEAGYCCGSGGSFNLQHYDISKQIGMRKRGHVVATGAREVATGCPACMMQLTDMLSRSGDRVTVRHAVEIYAESLDGPDYAHVPGQGILEK